jgi:hypothetical protein
MAPVPQQFKDAMAEELDGRLAVNLPPVRRREDGFGYDEVLSRFHNPFELSDIVREEGFTDLKLHWYNYHPTPPMISGKFDPREYRQAQIDLESDTSWRGMFMCSAGFIEATKR